MTNIPELLAQAMLVDRRSKRMAGELGVRAHSMAQAARNEDSATRRRTLEALANHLNEKAGRLRFSPRPDDYELSQTSPTEEASASMIQKGVESTIYLSDDSNFSVGDCSVKIHEAEYGPDTGWIFYFGKSFASDYTLLVCKSVGEIIRSYLVPSEVLAKHVGEDMPAELNIPVFDADWVEFRHNWSPLEIDS